jgi:capsular exopolysaccharide synthesis family protein
MTTTPHATDPTASGPPKSTGGLNLRTVFHAVKRHPLAMIATVLVAASAAVAVYVFLPLPKKAAAIVYHVANDPPSVVNPTQTDNIPLASYKPFQVTLMTNRKTMAEVLKDPKLKTLSMVPPGITPMEMSGYVGVDMRGNSEFMRIMIEGDLESELLELVAAVDRAYREASYQHDNRRRLQRRTTLEREFKAARDQLEAAQAHIDGIAQRLGSKDGAVLALIDRFRASKLEDAVGKAANLREDLSAAQVNLDGAKAYLKHKARQPAIAAVTGGGWLATLPRPEFITPSAVNDVLSKDQTLYDLERRADAALDRKTKMEGAFGDKAKRDASPAWRSAVEELEKAEKERNQYAKDAKARVEEAFRQQAAARESGMVDAAQAEVNRLTYETNKAEGKIKQLEKELEERNRYKIELETHQRQIAMKEQTANMLAGHIEAMRLEGSAPARVTVAEDPFVVSGIEGNRRLKFSLVAGVALFGLGFASLVFVEYRGRRVTHVDDATAALGARLVGTIPPLVPSSPGAASSDAHAILVESIDTARNILMHGTPGAADARVLLVTSAVSGEGKTTLSGHLAISLTRAGFRTLLVDGDIHAPSAHLLFNLPDAPGLSEVLRGEVSIATAVRQSPVAGLSVLPAGKWTLATRQALVGERWRHLAHELKAQFDFVVVDTSPLLLVSDTMLLAREADAVVLSVMMGFSQVSRVADTIHRLGAVGAELAGVVVNNVKSEVYDYGYAYRSKYPAAPNSPAALPGAALATAGEAAKE